MARKRTLNRADLRDQAEAAEAREKDNEEAEEEAVEEEAEEEADDEGGDDEEGGKKKKKAKAKPKAKKAPAAPKPKRTRTPKEVRLKAVWVVFDNSSKRVDTFPYSQKKEAEELLAQKIADKKTGFYMQMVKEPMEEK
jgi:hypothetical protein